MADKTILSKALVSLLEGNEAEAKKQFNKFINEAKVEIIAEKLTEKEEVEEVIPTDDKVAELKDEIKVEDPAGEEPVVDLDLDAEAPIEDLDTAEEVPAEEGTTEVVPVEAAEEALANSGEEVGIEEDEDFLALVDEFNKALEDDTVEVPSEEVEQPVEEVPAEEVSTEETTTEELPAEETSVEEIETTEETPVDSVAEPEKKQKEIDIEKFIK